MIFEDQEPEEIAKDTTFSEDFDIFGNFGSELLVIEETPKERLFLQHLPAILQLLSKA